MEIVYSYDHYDVCCVALTTFENPILLCFDEVEFVENGL